MWEVEAWFGPVQVTIFEAMPDWPTLNLVLGAAEPGAVEEGHLAAAIRWADQFDVGYRVTVAHGRPGTAKAEGWLNWHGFEQRRGQLRFVRDASPPDLPPATGMTVWEIGQRRRRRRGRRSCSARAGDAAAAPGLAPAVRAADSEALADLHGRAENDVVSFGSMLLQDRVALLGLEGTVEGFRGRGCNLTLLRQRILTAMARLPRDVAELEKNESEQVAVARGNLLRAGFVPACRSMNWQRPR